VRLAISPKISIRLRSSTTAVILCRFHRPIVSALFTDICRDARQVSHSLSKRNEHPSFQNITRPQNLALLLNNRTEFPPTTPGQIKLSTKALDLSPGKPTACVLAGSQPKPVVGGASKQGTFPGRPTCRSSAKNVRPLKAYGCKPLSPSDGTELFDMCLITGANQLHPHRTGAILTLSCRFQIVREETLENKPPTDETTWPFRAGYWGRAGCFGIPLPWKAGVYQRSGTALEVHPPKADKGIADFPAGLIKGRLESESSGNFGARKVIQQKAGENPATRPGELFITRIAPLLALSVQCTKAPCKGRPGRPQLPQRGRCRQSTSCRRIIGRGTAARIRRHIGTNTSR
jgi:hypothetical protein